MTNTIPQTPRVAKRMLSSDYAAMAALPTRTTPPAAAPEPIGNDWQLLRPQPRPHLETLQRDAANVVARTAGARRASRQHARAIVRDAEVSDDFFRLPFKARLTAASSGEGILFFRTLKGAAAMT